MYEWYKRNINFHSSKHQHMLAFSDNFLKLGNQLLWEVNSICSVRQWQVRWNGAERRAARSQCTLPTTSSALLAEPTSPDQSPLIPLSTTTRGNSSNPFAAKHSAMHACLPRPIYTQFCWQAQNINECVSPPRAHIALYLVSGCHPIPCMQNRITRTPLLKIWWWF